MSTDNIPTRTNGNKIDETWFNLIKQVLAGIFTPRNISGVPTDVGGELGSEDYRWKHAHIAAGYWSPGDVKLHHSFDGEVGPGQGWMRCDGRQITQANYDAEHGVGSWDQFIGVAPPLENKYLPQMEGRYPVGTSLTTQDGSAPITNVGHNLHLVDLAHAHQTVNHTHPWMRMPASGSHAKTYDKNGNEVDLATLAGHTGKHLIVSVSNADTPMDGVFNGPPDGKFNFTGGGGGEDTTEAGNPDQDIQPDSIEFQFYMRII